MMRKTTYAIIAHGGAGGIGYASRRKKGLIAATSIGYGILARGGSSLDAVEKAAMVLEDTTIFNAGTGASYNLIGDVEMDASLMTSELRYGAVAAIQNVRYPIHVARLVMEKTDHLLLGGDGAIKFARLMGVPYYNPKTREKRRVWRSEQKQPKNPYFQRHRNIAHLYGTIGVVAIDMNGCIAAATSSGGITMRLPGRIGDTPVIGAGTYADRNGGVSVTGHGEEIMRHMLAFRTVTLMGHYSAQRAGRQVMRYATNVGCRCGMIGIDKQGQFLCCNNTAAMSWCSIKNGQLKVFTS
jgi:beta-aspartyl-peptidase (threonine type)